MSIELRLSKYCNECPGFEAEVETDEYPVYQTFGGCEVHNTRIRCAHRKRCANIKRYLEARLRDERL